MDGRVGGNSPYSPSIGDNMRLILAAILLLILAIPARAEPDKHYPVYLPIVVYDRQLAVDCMDANRNLTECYP
jgi:hypothetical protein